MKMPSSHENLEDVLSVHRKLLNNYYKSALKHLRVALNSKPPVVEAFHPLIQVQVITCMSFHYNKKKKKFYILMEQPLF